MLTTYSKKRLLTCVSLFLCSFSPLLAINPLVDSQENVTSYGTSIYAIITAFTVIVIAIYSSLFIILYLRGDYRAPKRFRTFAIGLGILMIIGFIISYFFPNVASELPTDPTDVVHPGPPNDPQTYLVQEVLPPIGFVQPPAPPVGNYSSYTPPSYTIQQGFTELDRGRLNRLFQHYIDTLRYMMRDDDYNVTGGNVDKDYSGTGALSTYNRRLACFNFMNKHYGYSLRTDLHDAADALEAAGMRGPMENTVANIIYTQYYQQGYEATWEDVHNEALAEFSTQLLAYGGQEVPQDENVTNCIGSDEEYSSVHDMLYYFGSTWDRPRNDAWKSTWGYENDYYQDIFDEGNIYTP